MNSFCELCKLIRQTNRRPCAAELIDPSSAGDPT